MTEILQLGGALRARPAHETLKLIQPYIQKAGITRIADLTYLDCFGVPVYTCIRPNSKNLSTSQGKGITHELAMCSAYMEAIEQYYAESEVMENRATLSELNALFIHPAELIAGFIKASDISSIKFNWRNGYNLIDKNNYWVPVNYLSLDFSQIHHHDGLFKRTSTGLASGNNYEEAVCHSLFEIIERNAMREFEKLTLENKNKRLIDIDSVNSLHNRNLIEKITSQNAEIIIFDIANQFDVPTYHCIIYDTSPFRNVGNHSGSGTHFDKNIALSRAITEACQSRATLIAGSRDDINPQIYQQKWRSSEAQYVINFQDRVSFNFSSFNEQLDNLLLRLVNLSYDKVIVVQYTEKNADICVVHCLVPRLVI